jgi:basic membrane protein A
MKKELLGVVFLLGVAPACSLALNPELPTAGSAIFGAVCGSAGECASGLCQGGRCSQTCSASSPCPSGSGATCGAGGVCQFANGGDGAFGDTCSGNSDCTSALCVTGKCSQTCGGASTCPEVYNDCVGGQCTFLTTGSTAFGGKCSLGSDCQTGRCNDGRCTQPCGGGAACPGTNTECNTGPNLCRFLSPPPLTGDLKVGLLYVGTPGAHGWTQTHEEGREYFMAAIAGSQSEYVSFVSAATAGSQIDQFIANGNNVIIGTSFDFLVPMLSRAPNNPDVNFLLCSGFQTGPNLGSYFGRMYQVMYIMGVLAARKSVTGRIGLVEPVAIPETVRHTNAFARGARSVNPNAKIYIDWVEAWYDPPIEAAAAQRLIDEADVDVLMGHTDSIIPIQTAASATTASGAPIYVIGYDNRDSCEDAVVQSRCLTSAYWNWGPMVTKILQDMKAGTWLPEVPIWEQMKNTPEQSSVYFADLNTTLVNPTVRSEVEALIPALTANTEAARMLPFTAPVTDNAGRVRLEAGQTFTDEDLLEMCWLVEGVFNADGSRGTVPTNCVGVR